MWHSTLHNYHKTLLIIEIISMRDTLGPQRFNFVLQELSRSQERYSPVRFWNICKESLYQGFKFSNNLETHIFTITWGWCTLVTRGKLICPIKTKSVWTSCKQSWKTCLPGVSEVSRKKFWSLELLDQVFICNRNALFLFHNPPLSKRKILLFVLHPPKGESFVLYPPKELPSNPPPPQHILYDCSLSSYATPGVPALIVITLYLSFNNFCELRVRIRANINMRKTIVIDTDLLINWLLHILKPLSWSAFQFQQINYIQAITSLQ